MIEDAKLSPTDGALRKTRKWDGHGPAGTGPITSVRDRYSEEQASDASGLPEAAGAYRIRARFGMKDAAVVVVGLGNPGVRYERTRHNAGFEVLHELARRHGVKWRREGRAEVASLRLGPGKEVALLKPLTFMNASGAALVGYKAEGLIVVHGDLDLPVGGVQVKAGGGSGGHKGLGSVIARLGAGFVRVRVGVGRPPDGASAADHVLSRMGPEIEKALPAAADAVEAVLREGPEAAMNRFNARR